MHTHPDPVNDDSRGLLNRPPIRVRSRLLAGALLLLVPVVWSVIRVALAADPQLTISLLSTNQVQLTITNAVAGTNYAIHRRLTFDTNDQWRPHIIASPGQTSFVADMGIELQGFFRAIPCVDCDGDSVVDWVDANPYDSGVGALWITIDSPLSGENLNN